MLKNAMLHFIIFTNFITYSEEVFDKSKFINVKGKSNIFISIALLKAGMTFPVSYCITDIFPRILK